MKSLFYKYERTLKNIEILNRNTKSVVIEYLKCSKCKKICFIEIPNIECINCFFRERYKMTRKINEEYTKDEERKSVFETINIIKKMMMDDLEKLSDYIECMDSLELTPGFTGDMIVFWAKLIKNHIKETNKIPVGDELENIIYSW